MNTSFVTNCLSTLIVYTLVILCGCSEAPNLPSPSSLNEIEKACCLVHDGDGQAILVGFNDRADERVFLLTARHVAKYEYAPRNHVTCKVGKTHPMTFKNTRDRWREAEKEFDCAWFELTSDEIDELRTMNALTYIAITNGPNYVVGKGVIGTGTKGYLDIINSPAASTSRVMLIYQNRQVNGTATHKLYHCPFRLKYKNSSESEINEFISVSAPDNPKESDSGGAAFTEVSYQGQKFWMLSGVIMGIVEGENGTICAIAPIDSVLDHIRCSYRKLFDDTK